MRNWLAIAVLAGVLGWYVFVCFAAATYDDEGKKVTGARRWLRFLSLLPWPFPFHKG